MDDKHDKLDDFLRDQLNDSTENPSWNVPGDHVFENAMNALPKKKNNRRFWLIIPLLFLVVLAGREFMHVNQIKSLENKIAVLEESNNTASLNQANTINNEVTSGENQTNESDVNEESVISRNNIVSTQKPSDSNSYTTNDNASRSTASITTEKNSGTQANQIDTERNEPQIQSTPGIAQQIPTATNTAHSAPPVSMTDDATINTQGASSGFGEEQLLTTSDDQESMWLTSSLSVLSFSGLEINSRVLEIENPVPSVVVTTPSVTSLPLQYGILIGGNSSWLTMQNIPQGTKVDLYDYDNHQPGANAYAFIEKPLSKKFSLQAGIGYQYYQNQSVLEDKFLFDEDNVVMDSEGKEFYMAPIDVINPLGDMESMLDFRVSDQMHQNDILSEYTTMKQKLHAIHFDMSIGYNIVSIGRFDVAAGAGLSLGYLANIENDFNVSCYHNGELQSSRKESPKELVDSQKWYGQAIGRLDIAYRLTDRMSLVLESQYRGGISSLRRGTEANGSQTYLHSFGLSAGLKHNF